jgi:predicted MPP superfamily phosphohydrolase
VAFLEGVHRSPPQLALFFAMLTLVVGGVHYYLWFRLVRSAELGATWVRAGGWLFLFLALLTPAGMLLGRVVDGPLARSAAAVIFVWMGLAILLFFVLAGSELVRAAVRIAALATSGPLDPERRTFLSRSIAGVASLTGLVLAGAGMASALGKVALERVTVPLRRLPEALSGFRVVQVSDLHIGPTLGRGWLAQVVASINATDPDIVVITGDLVDGSVAELRAEVAPLADLKAKHGVFFVTGNHEYYSGADAWLTELRRLGVRPLRNERVSIGDGEHSFDLAGVDDWSAGRFGGDHGPDLARALAGRDMERELVLLAHQPKQIHEAEKLGVGLQLSGHTHGGQIFPWGYMVKLDQPYLAGLAQQGGTQIYVSRGTGFWGPPMRVGAAPEITVLSLVRAA